jgi:tetratricopeptide (TPR) repeat protein
MTNPNVEETAPVTPERSPEAAQPPRKRWPWILAGLAIVLIGLFFGSFFGYQRGLAMRLDAEESQLGGTLDSQFQLAQEDLTAGRLTIAQRRLEYILQLDPEYPGAKEALTNVLISIQLTSTPSTPTPSPSPTLTPTPDNRSEQQMFDEAVAYLGAQEWDAAIQSLEALRNTNIDVRSVDVDGLYYIALTNRGIRKILQDGSLESGIYDLTLAEKIGPLDANAINYRKWARMYLTAASYWDVDWEMVLRLFGDIYPAMPGLRDGSGMTATERYRQERWCDAEAQYNAALAIAEDPAARAGLEKVVPECHPPTATPEPATPTPTTDPNITPTEVTPDPAVTEQPTETPPAP